MKKKKKGGSSRTGDGVAPSALIAHHPAPPSSGSTLDVSKSGILDIPVSGEVPSPDLEVASAGSGDISSCSEDGCSSDEECPNDPVLGVESGPARDPLAIGITASGSGNNACPQSSAGLKPKMGAWRNLFVDNRSADSSTMLSHYSDISNSKTCILEEVDTPCDEWKRCLIGYIAGKYPGFAALRSIIANNWRCDALLSIHESGWLVYNFKNEDDKLAVLNGGPYLIYGRPLILKSMPEFFDFSKKEMASVPVWVKFPNLPLKCWSLRSLSKISSLLGKPIQCDRLTASKGRISYARVLIEIDLREHLPVSVPIGLPNGHFIDQLVIFESLPQFCKTCNSIGHSSTNCGKSTAQPAHGKNASDTIPVTGNVFRRMSRARSAGPAARKSGTDAGDSASAGPTSGMVEKWVAVGRNGKPSGPSTAQIACNQPTTPQQPHPPTEDVQISKAKGKEVLDAVIEADGLSEPGPQAACVAAGQLVNPDPTAPLTNSGQASGNSAGNTLVLPKEMEVRKSVRKLKKPAKGVPTSSAAL